MFSLIRHLPVGLCTAIATLLVLLVPAQASAATLGCVDDTAGVVDLQSWVPELLDATNAYRATKNLAPLALDATLTRTSLWKARDMARRNYFAHDDPALGDAPARTPWLRLSACGYTANAYKAENIAAGQQSAQATVQAWIDSPGHRANLENAKMRYVGFGVSTSTTSTYKRYMVQMFASEPGPAAAQPPISNEPASDQSGATDEGDGSTSGGGGSSDGEQGSDRQLRGGDALRARATKHSAAVTKRRCKSKRAVRGYCYTLVVRATVRDTAGSAVRGRRVVVTRRATSGRYVRVGVATSRSNGTIVLRRQVKPSARSTRSWLTRNARTIRITVARAGDSAGSTTRRLARIPR